MKDFETFDFQLLGDDAMSWKIHRVQDHTAVAEYNRQDQLYGNNGWKPGRGARQIGRIPADALEAAELMGYDMDSMEGIYKFLNDYPQFRAVQYIKSPVNGSAASQGRIIIN